MDNRKLKVIEFGTSDYQEIMRLQDFLLKRRKQGFLCDILLLGEHHHVITLGRRAHKETDILKENKVLQKMEIPVYSVMRGGLATYHGPGQIVGYPVMDLRGGRKRLHQFVECLGEFLVDVLAKIGIEAYSDVDRVGAWVKDEKIASIGLGLKGGITFHGFALNVNTDISYFNFIVPCGLEGIKMTSVKDILQKEISINQVKKIIVECFTNKFEKSSYEIIEYASFSEEAFVA